jgi:hypothetical protein
VKNFPFCLIVCSRKSFYFINLPKNASEQLERPHKIKNKNIFKISFWMEDFSFGFGVSSGMKRRMERLCGGKGANDWKYRTA